MIKQLIEYIKKKDRIRLPLNRILAKTFGFVLYKPVSKAMKEWGISELSKTQEETRFQIHENLRRLKWHGIKGNIKKESQILDYWNTLQEEIEWLQGKKTKLIFEGYSAEEFYFTFGIEGQKIN